MKNKKGIFAGVSFALLSVMPFISLGMYYGRTPLGTLKSEPLMCGYITIFAIIAFYIGYKYAERILSSQNKFEQFKIGCIMAIRIAILSALSIVPIALIQIIIPGPSKESMDVLSIIKAVVVSVLYMPLVYLIGCCLFSWLILPIAGFGCILINFIHKHFEHE